MGRPKNGEGCPRLCRHGKLAGSKKLDPEGGRAVAQPFSCPIVPALHCWLLRTARRCPCNDQCCPRKRLPVTTKMEIWRTFIEAKAGHSSTDARLPRKSEAADHGEITRENEIMMLAALGRRSRRSRPQISPSTIKNWSRDSCLRRSCGMSGGTQASFLWFRAWASSHIGARPANDLIFAPIG